MPRQRATDGEPVLPERDQPILVAIMAYFGIAQVRVEPADTPGSDIGVRLPKEGMPVIVVGRKGRRNQRRNPVLAHKQLVHEAAHIYGLPHSAYLRRRGYYSKDRRRDRLSEAMYRDIRSGTPRFEPERFGLDPRRIAPRRPR